jgi:hypothetical protein
LWRKAFDTVERPVAAGLESWVQSDTFMDLTVVAVRLRRRAGCELRRASEPWLHLVGLTSHGDAVRLMNQVASLERQVRELRARIESGEGSLSAEGSAHGSNGASRRGPDERSSSASSSGRRR